MQKRAGSEYFSECAVGRPIHPPCPVFRIRLFRSTVQQSHSFKLWGVLKHHTPEGDRQREMSPPTYGTKLFSLKKKSDLLQLELRSPRSLYFFCFVTDSSVSAVWVGENDPRKFRPGTFQTLQTCKEGQTVRFKPEIVLAKGKSDGDHSGNRQLVSRCYS